MKKVNIKLYGVDEVKRFVNTISQYGCEFDLTSGRYVIDAKSMMGIFSLDLKKPLALVIHCDDEAAISEIIKSLSEFIEE